MNEPLRPGGTPMAKRVFDPEFKLQVVRQLLAGEKSMAQLCREHRLCQTVLHRWREQFRQHGENAWTVAPAARSEASELKARITDLEAALGRAHMEIEYLQFALESLRKGGSLPPRNTR